LSAQEQDQALDAAALTIAKRAGLLVIALGIVDTIHGFVSAPEGTLHFRIGGLLVGVLMLFGGLRILAVVRWLSLLAAAVLLTGVLTSFFVVPVGLTLAQIRLYPMAFAAGCIPGAVSIAIALVAAVRLSHPQLLAARARVGRSVHSARIPLVLGTVLAIGGAYLEYRVLDSEAAHKASRAVAEKLGPDYHYFTNSLNRTIGKPSKYSATVQAWNDRAVLSVPVRWEE
jgi:hypothetical protein